MIDTDPYLLRAAGAEDQGALRSLFEAVPPSGPALVARNQRESEWIAGAPKSSPDEAQACIAEHTGRPVAHAELRSLRMRLAGDPARLGELAAVCTQRAHLRGLPAPGLTVALLRQLLDLGKDDPADLGAFALFDGPLWRIAGRFLGFEMVRWFATLERAPGAGDTRLPTGVEFLDDFDEQVLWLYDRACLSWSVSALRDADYLTWRVAEHPRRRYRTLGMRDAEGILRGYAVTTLQSAEDGLRLWIADWLIPHEEHGVGAGLLDGVLSLARSSGAGRIIAGFPEWSPWHLWFQEAGFAHRPGDWLLGVRTRQRSCDSFVMRDSWWHQPLDLGLV